MADASRPFPMVVPRAAEPAVAVGPSRDARGLLVSAIAYLLLLVAFLLASGVLMLLRGSGAVPDRLVDVRDLVALLGWVGFTISGVSVIVVPSHFRTPIRPRVLPRLHLVLANTGLVGFFVVSLAVHMPALSDAFLVLVALSYGAFAVGVLRALLATPPTGSSGAARPGGPPPEARPGP